MQYGTVGDQDDVIADAPPGLLDHIDRLRAHAEDVRGAALRLPAGAGEVGALRERVVRGAEEMGGLAAGPVTIGVVGEFSAGKSLLLGLLLGRPDLLPVNDDPTTANVTALHLSQGAPGAPTAITAGQVEYLTQADLDDCLDHMLRELTLRATAAGLPAGPVEALRAEPDRFWPALTDWSREQAWPTGNAPLTLLVRELMRLGDAVLAAPAYLGWTQPVPPAVFAEALTLPRADSDPGVFPERRIPAAGLGSRPAQLAAAQLHATLPLVKRVTLYVEVAPHIWDLRGLRGHNQLVLLDFPGLGSTVSGVRDNHLSRRELAEVSTILILLNAQTAGSDGPTAFPTMMQRPREQLRDRVLVGIGRFDQLPNLIDPGLYTDGGGQVTDQVLTDGVLRTVMSNARLLVGTDHDERIMFHSAMVGIDALNAEHPGPHYDAGFDKHRRLGEHLPRSREVAATWGRVADRLTVDDPGSSLRPALAEFARDGGVDLIRRRLARHVEEHGLALRLDDLDRAATALDGLREQLVEEARRDSTGAEAARLAARAPVESLIDAIGRQLADLERRVAPELIDPRQVRLRDGATLAEAIEQRAVEDVFTWPEWTRLFESVRETVIVPQAREAVPDFDDEDDEDDTPGGGTDLPATTGEFAERFARTVAACDEYAVNQAWEAYGDWVRRANHELEPARARRREVLDADAEQRIRDRFGDRGYPQVLARSLDLGWLPGLIRPGIDQAFPARAQADLLATFPLRADAGFAWSRDAPPGVRESAVATLARHQIRPARLRRELIRGVVDAVLARLGELHVAIAGQTEAKLGDRRDKLAGRSERFIQTVVGAPDTATDDLAAELAAIRRPGRRG